MYEEIVLKIILSMTYLCKVFSWLLLPTLIYDCCVLSLWQKLTPYDNSTELDLGIISDIAPTCIFGVDTVSLFLYGNDTGDMVEVDLNTADIPANPTRTTVFLIHGFTSEANITQYINLANNWIELNRSNVFGVDWKQGACDGGIEIIKLISYPSAASNTKVVADYIARFMGLLIDKFSFRLEDMILVGHSLGAHVAGFTGQALQQHGIGKIPRIVGLDPASPEFEHNSEDQRISESDADFVQIIHTSNVFGMRRAVGHVDYYFNGGIRQPGCNLIEVSCTHGRAVTYFTEIIKNPECQFIGKPWNRSDRIPPAQSCTVDECSVVGPRAIEFIARGTFFVPITSEPPYCGDERLVRWRKEAPDTSSVNQA